MEHGARAALPDALPLAIIAGIAGLIRDASKKYAIAGLVIGGLTCVAWALPMVLL